MAGNYLPPGLTDEDVELALAATRGGRPELAPELPVTREAAPPAPMPPPEQVTPEPPMVEPPVADAPAAEAPKIERATGNTAKRLDTYRGQQVDTANEILENRPGIGDEQGLTQKGHEDLRAVHERSGKQNAAIADDAEARVAARREHEALSQANADRIYADMEAHKQPPPQSMVSQIMGMLGGLLTSKSAHGGAITGALMNMVGGDNGQRWEQEQQANSHLYQAAMSGVKSDRDGSINDLDVAGKMAALRAHEINDSLNAVKEMNLGERANAVITDAQLQFKGEFLKGLATVESQKLAAEQAAAAKGAALRRKTAEEEQYLGIDPEVLRKLRDKGFLKPAGIARLNEIEKSRGIEEGVRKTQADTEKTQREATGAGGPKTEFEGKIQAMVAPLAGPDGPIARLESRLYGADGKELPNDKVDIPYVGTERGGSTMVPERMIPTSVLQHQADVNTLRQVFVRARSGAGIKETEAEDELRAMGVYSKDDQVAAQGLKQLVKSVRSLDKYKNLQAPGTPAASNKPKQLKTFQRDESSAARTPLEDAQDYLDNMEGGV
jgi:hypothetical protein